MACQVMRVTLTVDEHARLEHRERIDLFVPCVLARRAGHGADADGGEAEGAPLIAFEPEVEVIRLRHISVEFCTQNSLKSCTRYLGL